MSLEGLSERLAALQESNSQLKDLIDHLATIKFEPGSAPLNNNDDNVMVELTTDIQQTINDQEEDFEILQEEVCDIAVGRIGSDLEQGKASLEQAVIRARKELKSYQINFRRAQLLARQSLRSAQRLERELLLRSYLEPPSPTQFPELEQYRRGQYDKELSSDNKTVNASSDVTLALRRTHNLMANELSRSQFAHDTLKESTAALAQLNESTSTLDTLLSSSRNLLGTLMRSQKSDTWYLETAFMVLSCTIAWLVFRRLLYGPIYGLIYLPLKWFFRFWMACFTLLGLKETDTTTISGDVASEPNMNSATDIPPQVSIEWQSKSSERFVDSENNNEGLSHDKVSDGELIEEVGRIIDEAHQHHEEANEQYGAQRNPRKRLWEEDVAQDQRQFRDEL